MKIIWSLYYGHTLFKVHGHRFKTSKPCLICHIRYLWTAELTDYLPCLIKRIQEKYPPIFTFRQESLLPVPSIKMFYLDSIAYLELFFKYFSTSLLTFPPKQTIIFLAVIFLAVAVGMFLGIKFMISSAEDKAKVKEALIPYIAGCVVIFGAFIIWKLTILLLGRIA